MRLAIAALMVTVSASAAADEKVAEVAGRSPRLRARPQLAIGADFGFAHYGRVDAKEDLGFGPAWQGRVGAQLWPWLALDARYFGARHDAVGALVAHAGSLEARFSIPLRLRPYVSSGIGWYTVLAFDASGELLVAPSPASMVPISLGLEVLLHDRVGLQAEGSYRVLFDRASIGSSHFARTQLWGAALGARAYF